MTYIHITLALLLSGCVSSTYTEADSDAPVAGAPMTEIGGASSADTVGVPGGSSVVSPTSVATGGASSSSTVSSTGGAAPTSVATGGFAGVTLVERGGAAGLAYVNTSQFRTPKMVASYGILVDETEVTHDQYTSWSNSTAPIIQHPDCADNDNVRPRESSDHDPNRPVMGVDWCDAYSYCAAVGKRMCEYDELQRSCSRNGAIEYNTAPGCVTQADSVTEPQAVSGRQQCVTDGIWDLTGNAPEWLGTCDGLCQVFQSSLWYAKPTCVGLGSAKRSAQVTSGDTPIGFRCCKG